MTHEKNLSLPVCGAKNCRYLNLLNTLCYNYETYYCEDSLSRMKIDLIHTAFY